MSKTTQPPMPKVEAKLVGTRLRVYIDETLHLSLPTEDGIQIHTYVIGKMGTPGCNYHIDITAADHTSEVSYIRKEIWQAVLKELEKLTSII